MSERERGSEEEKTTLGVKDSRGVRPFSCRLLDSALPRSGPHENFRGRCRRVEKQWMFQSGEWEELHCKAACSWPELTLISGLIKEHIKKGRKN